MKRIHVKNVVSGGTIPAEDMPRQVAYHEAGHAVVAVSLGVSVSRASRGASPGQLGRVDYVPSEMKAYHAIMIAYGGTIAEQLGTNTTSLQGREADEAQAREVAEMIGFPDATRAVPDVLDLLIHNWGAVEAVAQALLERVELDGALVHDLIRGAPTAVSPKEHLDRMLGRSSPQRGPRRRTKRGRGRGK